MEGGSVAAFKAMKSYWRRRGYVRLLPPVLARPGRGCSRNTWSPWTRTFTKTKTKTRRFWRPRVRLVPKLKIFKFITSSKKALLRLRDGYMEMMLGFASSSICTRGGGGGGYYHGKATSSIDQAGYGFGKAPLKEYDRKVIVEIYRTVIAAADGKVSSP